MSDTSLSNEDISANNEPDSSNAPLSPSLVTSYCNYNIIRYGDRYLSAPRNGMEIDFTRPEEFAAAGVLVAKSLREAQWKIWREGDDRYIDPLQATVPLETFDLPEVIEIEPAHTCNLRCIMCHVSYETLTKTMLDPAVIPRLKGLEGKWVKLGSLYEPAAHPRFAEIVMGLSDLGMKIDLISNGSLFTPALIKRIADANYFNVVISFDGATRETYERVRRRGDFDRTVERIVAFRKAVKARNPRCFFQINYTIVRENMAEVEAAVDMWERNDFDHIGFIPMVLRDQNPELQQQTLGPVMAEAREHIVRAARRIVENGYRITMGTPFLREADLVAAHPDWFPLGPGLVRSAHPGARIPFTPTSHFQNGPFPGMAVNCRSPYKFARIWYDGSVHLCQQIPTGSLYEEDFIDIWHGEASQSVRNAVAADVSICYQCEYYKFCIKANEVDTLNEETLVSSNKVESCGTIGPYFILKWMEKYYGVPFWIGSVRPPFIGLNKKGGFVSSTLEQARSTGVTLIQSVPPAICLETWNQCRIWQWGDVYIGVPYWLDTGQFDPFVIYAEYAGDITKEGMLVRLKEKLKPRLCNKRKHYNTYYLHGRFVALDHSIDPASLSRESIARLPLSGKTEAEMELRIIQQGMSLPRLIVSKLSEAFREYLPLIIGDTAYGMLRKSVLRSEYNDRKRESQFGNAGHYRDYVLVTYKGMIHGLPPAVSAVDLNDENARTQAGVLRAYSRVALLRQIDAALKRVYHH